MDPENVLPNGDPTPAVPASATVRRPRGVVCEFCDCTLAEDGGVINRGEKAGHYLDQDRMIVKLKDKIEELSGALGEKDRTIADLRGQLDSKKTLW